MAENMFKLKRVQWCHPGQLHRIISALEYDARRHGRLAKIPEPEPSLAEVARLNALYKEAAADCTTPIEEEK